MVPQLSPADPPVTKRKQVCVDKVELFPHLTDAEFDEACSTLLKRFELQSHHQHQWSAVESLHQSETMYLRITKFLASSKAPSGAADDGGEMEWREEDDEVAETPTTFRAAVHYDVVLSPSYRVPVLYFYISDTLHRYPPTMETLYSTVIPSTFRAQAEHVGVIGGITITVGLRENQRHNRADA